MQVRIRLHLSKMSAASGTNLLRMLLEGLALSSTTHRGGIVKKEDWSEFPAMKQRIRKRKLATISKLIEKEVSYFNGWAVSEESMRDNCSKAAENILRYLERRYP